MATSYMTGNRLVKVSANLEEFKNNVKNYMPYNKFRCIIYSNANSSIGKMKELFPTNLWYNICDVSIGGFKLEQASMYIGGQRSVSSVNGFSNGDLKFNVVNTGKEYPIFYEWFKMHYNKEYGYFGYFNDIKVNISIEQLNHLNYIEYAWFFTGCILSQGFPGFDIKWGDSAKIESFGLELTYTDWEFGYNTSVDKSKALTKF